MNSTQKLQIWSLILFSAISSFLFVFYTVTVYFSDDVTTGLKWFAYVTGGYGLMNIYILSWAWHSRSEWAVKFDILIAGCLLGVIGINMIRSASFEVIPGIAVIIVAALVLYINVMAVKQVCGRPES